MQRMPILSDSAMSLFELKTRYVRNYLTFAGKNSKDFLLVLSRKRDTQIGRTADLRGHRRPGRHDAKRVPKRFCEQSAHIEASTPGSGLSIIQ